jgi:hypothetical protein
MGESCEEGGPSPSHKIPQKRKELRRNAQNDLLFICQNVSSYNIQSEHAPSL